MDVHSGGREPLEVVVAGGGVAAMETVLALHALAAGRVRMRVVAPNRDFVNPALSVAAPFDLVDLPSWNIARLARDHGASVLTDALAAVDADQRLVATTGGERLRYDALVLATGARRVPALAGALTFSGPRHVRELAALVRQAEQGELRQLAFAVPRGVVWTLPAYELALLTAAHLAARGVRGVELSIASAERSPLAIFGRSSSDTVAALLRDAGITLRTVPPERVEDGALVLADGEWLPAERVVALPRLESPQIDGVPRGGDGFIATDLHCKVNGLEAVYAAGDATWFPVKQGGVATQQADVVAAAIAAEAGAASPVRSFRPVLRGALLTGSGVRYMRARPNGAGLHPREDALWWPPAKIAGRYLGPYLAGADAEARPLHDLAPAHLGAEHDTLALAFEAADADAGWGDLESALRWLSVAERLGVVLPEDYATKRARWRDALADLSITR